MKTSKHTVAPRLVLRANLKHLVLVVLHFIVFTLSAVSDNFVTVKATTGTLP